MPHIIVEKENNESGGNYKGSSELVRNCEDLNELVVNCEDSNESGGSCEESNESGRNCEESNELVRIHDESERSDQFFCKNDLILDFGDENFDEYYNNSEVESYSNSWV
ncbi:15186_t:CDS:1 [Dentiscutata erythropus]|uniref:15186_t:CDS:1 n=1 Tax=Dentiscutata erythropus TaxID=1348616 RepID=A0A9N9A6C6_9GLOM|nr:15186_t:CDS:1 [Dentiscutata erythropus]